MAPVRLPQRQPTYVAFQHGRSRDLTSGMTLLEVLVITLVLALLMSLFLPALLAARESARRLSCQQHLRQQGVALTTYADLLMAYPPGWNTWGHGWTAFLLPYLEHQSLYDLLVFQEEGDGNWDSGHGNTRAIRQYVAEFRCPSLPVPRYVTSNRVANRVPASYRGNAGSLASSDDHNTLVVPGTRSLEDLQQNGIFYACSQVRPADVLDGLSCTLGVGESRTDPKFIKDGQAMDFWYIGSAQIDDCRCDGGSEGTEFSEFVGTTFSPLNAAQHTPRLHGVLLELSFGSYHPGGCQVLRLDGGVTFLSDDVALPVLRAWSSRADGDEVPRAGNSPS